MINIMFAGNYKVFDGLLIASLSILKHCKDPITVYVLTMDLSEQNENYKSISQNDIDKLEKLYKEVNKGSSVIRVDVKDFYLRELLNSPNSESFYTPYALLRLLVEQVEIIPDKVLYLDTDVVANSNISELYNIDISNYEIAGVRDYYGKFFFYPNYINSGVLLMNMRRIRETKLLTKALRMCSRKKVFLPDQTAINKCAKKKLIINRKFNEQKKVTDKTVIRHFSMTIKFFPWFRTQNIKPWHIEKVHNILKCHHFDDILEDYQQKMKSFNEDKKEVKSKEKEEVKKESK